MTLSPLSLILVPVAERSREKNSQSFVLANVPRMFDHCFGRNKLQNRANRILGVRHAIPKNAYRLLQLLRIVVLDVCISDFWPVEDAAERLLGKNDIAGKHTAGESHAKPGHEDNLR